ncbi:MAG: dicarboxylate/amino acid:cation symporter [Synergistaceae bacterium]|jgi:Na+/H+-dicarboxylate symporter|nr:dicarboxylate/amino acid:cation symporter [Synergistaceae bacterium]
MSNKKVSLLWKISIGFVLGIAFGFVAGPMVAENAILGGYVMPFLDAVGKIFLTLLKMLIVPLVFSSIVVGAASVGDPKTLGRIGVKTLVLYLVTTAVAIVIGLALGNIIQPGVGMNISGVTAEPAAAKPLLDVFLDIFPSNPIDSLVKANMLQIIVFALFFGVASLYAGEKGKRIVGAFESVAEVMYSMTHMIMRLAPYGVFSLIAVTASKYGLSILAPFAKVIAAVYLGCVLHALIVYSGLIAVFCKRSPLWYFKGVQEASITAFVTRSSSGTLPITIANVQENLGVSEKISSFVLPLGATINMDGTALYQGVCALFVAQAFGMELGLNAQIGIIVTATLASIGTAGVPGAGLIMLTLVLTGVGLPIEGIGLVAGIDAVLDAIRTCVNVTGDTAVCAAVAASEGEKLSK